MTSDGMEYSARVVWIIFMMLLCSDPMRN